MDALSAAAAAMRNDAERLRAISQNIANAGTTGFKREFVVAMPPQIGQGDADEAVPGGAMPAMALHTDHTPGSLKSTGAPYDVALEGAGFFVVATEQGEAYTRNGVFQRTADGSLVDAAGRKVVFAEGDLAAVSGAPRIDSSGAVWDGERIVARLKLAQIDNPDTLQRADGASFLATEQTRVSAGDRVRVRQGFQEVANVNSMTEMVRLIETMRHFEASQKMLRGYDNMLDRAINSLGDLT